MENWFPLPIAGIPKFTPTDVIDILVVAFLIYQFLLIIRGRRAAHVLMGLCILAAIYGLALWANRRTSLAHALLWANIAWASWAFGKKGLHGVIC